MTSVSRILVPKTPEETPEYLKKIQDALTDDSFQVKYTNVDHASSVTGVYQRLGRITFMLVHFKSDGALKINTTTTVKTPTPPFLRGTYYYAANEFKLSNTTAGAYAVTQWYMDNANGLLVPSAATGPTANDLILSGWYYTE